MSSDNHMPHREPSKHRLSYILETGKMAVKREAGGRQDAQSGARDVQDLRHARE